jgi:hypothetical protein
LPEWGRNGWKWEHFGEMVPVKNQDLWQRLDRALKIHRIQGTAWRIDSAHTGQAAASGPSDTAPSFGSDALTVERLREVGRGLWLRFRLALAERCERVWLSAAQLGTSLLPYPWLK